MIEPTNNVLQSLDPMPRLTGTRELVRFIGEPHHHRRNFPKLKRTEHFLATCSRRCAMIDFAQNEHHRGLHLLDVSDRRSRFEVLFLVERWPLEPERLKQSKIRRVP